MGADIGRSLARALLQVGMDLIPQLGRHDTLMFPGMAGALVHGLTEIEPVAQQLVQKPLSNCRREFHARLWRAAHSAGARIIGRPLRLRMVSGTMRMASVQSVNHHGRAARPACLARSGDPAPEQLEQVDTSVHLANP